MTTSYLHKLFEARDALSAALKLDSFAPRPSIAIVLGSGLFDFAEKLKQSSNAHCVAFKDIPHIGNSTVEGHKGEIVAGTVNDKDPIIVLSGRLHFYEGFEPADVVLPIRLMGLLGINKIILTNACGAIGDNFEPGQLMAIKDHINFTGHSPLVGPNIDELGPRFVDLTTAYDREFIAVAKNAAQLADITMHEGVYAAMLGPCYETPAEIRMLKNLGADAVGMSTVFETIVARHMGMRVLGLSCLTNKAAGLSQQEISHQEVMENNAKVAQKFATVLQKIVSDIS